MARDSKIEDELSALWEKGIPLSNAWVHFSPTVEYFDIRALSVHPDNDDMIQDDPRYKHIKGWLPGTFEARQKKLEWRTRDLRIDLVSCLYGGELLAIGMRTDADGSEKLRRVPREAFYFNELKDEFPRFDWDKDVLFASACAYIDIRVTESPSASSKDTSVPARAPEQATGRPNTSEKIRQEAERALKEPEFCSLENRDKQAEEIRARILGEEFREAHHHRGYRASTIKRLIGEVVKQKPT